MSANHSVIVVLKTYILKISKADCIILEIWKNMIVNNYPYKLIKTEVCQL